MYIFGGRSKTLFNIPFYEGNPPQKKSLHKNPLWSLWEGSSVKSLYPPSRVDFGWQELLQKWPGSEWERFIQLDQVQILRWIVQLKIKMQAGELFMAKNTWICSIFGGNHQRFGWNWSFEKSTF